MNNINNNKNYVEFIKKKINKFKTIQSKFKDTNEFD